MRSSFLPAAWYGWAQSCIGATLIAGLALIAGCGGSSTSSQSASSETTATPSANAASSAANLDMPNGMSASGEAAAGKTRRRRDEVWEDEKGQKWFGNVPMDAFFDEPYAVASDTTPVGGGTSSLVAANVSDPEKTTETPVATDAPVGAGTVMKDAVTTSPSETAPSAATVGDDSWGSLISKAVLEDEVKSIRNFMNENLQSVGTFNSSMLMIPPKAAALGALAGVATEHPDAVSWKEDAKYIRDLARQMNESPLQRGAKDQKRLQGLFEALSDTLNRSKPAGLEEPAASMSFADVSEMRLLMMRMEEAEKRMKTEAGSEAAMSSKKEMINHEASMMAVMARIVTLPGYGYEDDAEFTGYGNEIVSASGKIRMAAESNDFAAYESGLTTIATTCQKCHSKYKND